VGEEAAGGDETPQVRQHARREPTVNHGVVGAINADDQ